MTLCFTVVREHLHPVRMELTRLSALSTGLTLQAERLARQQKMHSMASH